MPVMLTGCSNATMPGSLPALATLQSPSVELVSLVSRFILVLAELTPNWKRPSSKSNVPSTRPSLISFTCDW